MYIPTLNLLGKDDVDVGHNAKTKVKSFLFNKKVCRSRLITKNPLTVYLLKRPRSSTKLKGEKNIFDAECEYGIVAT